uniref:Uncharacterized protein n=1 Tax=Panagrolaimus superbus TaxID=310955 RepID=A0A914Z2I1_9BILA
MEDPKTNDTDTIDETALEGEIINNHEEKEDPIADPIESITDPSTTDPLPTIPPPTEAPVTEAPTKTNLPLINKETLDNNMKLGFESIKFIKNNINRYVVNFDSNYVKLIQVSGGFANVLGFTWKKDLLNNDIADENPSVETYASHICIYINNILRPLIDEKNAEIGTILIDKKEKSIYTYYQTPIWFKLETTRIDTLSIEMADFFGYSIAGDNAHGHFVLAFINHKF